MIEQQSDSDKTLTEHLDNNPLPNVIEIVPASKFNTSGQLEKMIKELQNLPNVMSASVSI